MAGISADKIKVGNVELEIQKGGSGKTLVYFHSHLGMWKTGPFLKSLAERFSILAPCSPGFEESPVDENFTTIDDLSYLYLDMLDVIGDDDVVLAGSSLGAWLAMAVAIKNVGRISALALINPVGAHFSGPEEEDIADMFSMGEDEFVTKAFANPELGRKNYPDMSDYELLISSRNREAGARYAWMPAFYDTGMANRLGRIRVPTLIIHGECDAITKRSYVDAMAEKIPDAKVTEMPGAGHFAHIERPEETANLIGHFAAGVLAGSREKVKS